MKRIERIFMVFLVLLFYPSIEQLSASTIPESDSSVLHGKSGGDGTRDVNAENMRKRILEVLPPAKEGFRWALYKGVALQRPVEWHEHIGGGTYCSSVESVLENGVYQTGVSIQVVRGVSRVFNVSPKTMMARYVVDLYQEKDNTKLIASPGFHGDIESLVYRYRNAPENLESIIVHKYFQVSEKEDYLNIITFETTEEQWVAYWDDVGKTILGKVLKIPYF